LGGFIGEEEALNEWLGEKTKFWTEAVTDLTSVTQAFPQAAYSGLQKSLQQEWQFVQRVTKGIGPEFAAVEQTLAKTFLPTLFGDEHDDDDPRRALAGLPVKWAGLAIPDPTTLAQPNYEASILLCFHFWLRSEASISSDRQTTSRSSGTSRLSSNFAMLRKASPASTT
jgi:hypothetical protein